MPEHLRELGKVGDGIYFQGAGDFFFVWNPVELGRMGPEWKSAQAACAKLVAAARKGAA
jgi:MraZ protein